jgi:hypothetical protein
MAQQRDLTVDRGSDIAIELHLVEEDNTPKNLAGFIAAGKIKKTYNTTDSDQIFDFSVSYGSPIGAGIINLLLDRAKTELMKPGRYVYDVELMNGDLSDVNTTVERILEGKLTVTPSVTR